MLDLLQLKSLLEKGQLIVEDDLQELCEKVKELLMEESNVVPVNAPVNLCGDLHG